MLVGCSGFSYASCGWYFPYVLRTRQVELAYLGDMYCCRIEDPDGYASWSLVTEILNQTPSFKFILTRKPQLES